MLEKGCIGESIIEGNTKPVSTMDAEQAADNEANAMLTISIVVVIIIMSKVYVKQLYFVSGFKFFFGSKI